MPELLDLVRRSGVSSEWSGATEHRGAFHRVLVHPDGKALRAAIGRGSRERSRREAAVLRTLEAVTLPIEFPRLLEGPREIGSSGMWAMVTTLVAGTPTEDLTSMTPERSRGYAGILGALQAADTTSLPLPAPRAWCGGPDWPALVRTDLLPLLPRRLASTAHSVLDGLAAAEAGVGPVLCHGDFGPHNLLWNGAGPTGLIDLDHACLGDPAMDLAPLISFHGAAGLTGLAPAEVIHRAMVHRATLPLQIAAAAHRADLTGLREHALTSFTARADSGTLHDPGGLQPRRVGEHVDPAT